MRILIFTTFFAPSIGGIERVAALLAREFAGMGHDVTVATPTPGDGPSSLPYRVVREPSLARLTALLRRCDVHLQLNLSLKYLHPLLLRTPFVVSHHTIYTRASGERGFRDRMKLALGRRLTGVAVSRYVAAEVGCPEVVGNPYDHTLFRRTASLDERAGELVFLGRLVSEKGCDVLIDALALLRERMGEPACTIIGEGPERPHLADLAAAHGLERLRFLGALEGEDLVQELNRHRILIVPSRCHEAFGIVALEGLACGCLPIVAARGGLGDAIGPHGLTFEDGPTGLAARIEEALEAPALAARVLEGSEAHLANFTAPRVAERYLAVLERAAAA